MSCRFRGRTGRPEDAAENVSSLRMMSRLMLVPVMMSAMQGGMRKGRLWAQERAGSVVKLRRCSLARTAGGCPPPSGLRTLTLGVTAPSLPCSTTDFTKVGIFSWFLACREPPGHLAGGGWRFWAMQQIARQSQPLFWPLSRGGKREEKTKPIMT